ncbi:cytochrome P450 52A12 [Pleomassaria siparia CBS 279.74]|uniref:Cytochrome P450 52A12 n=1 Tax=Pleomassaria siparia CBS 279.74 TaxID=1314801 RepID=A0A6G1K4Q6_9PLEO|nr:cytochrome P450 52A12 [Pleomassaria siparia CBS 279.74]
MHISLFASLWAVFFYLLYRVAFYISIELRHRSNARRLGCKQPALMEVGLFGIKNVRLFLKAHKESRIPDHVMERDQAYCDKVGKQVHTFNQNILGSTAIFTTEPKNIQTILAIKFKEFGLGESRNSNFFPLLGKGIFSTDGKQWEHSRALLRPQFARDQVADIDLEEGHMQSLFRCLPITPNGWTEVADMKTLFFRFTMDTATEFLFGVSVNSQLANLPGYSEIAKERNDLDDGNFTASFDASLAVLARASMLGDMYWMSHTKDFKENCGRCHDFIDRYINLALSEYKSAPQTHKGTGKPKYVFLDAIVEESRDPLFLRAQLLSILLAGRDTTASLLSFVFVMFLKHPAVFTKLRNVIVEDFGTYNNPKEISFTGLKNCQYLQWVLNETLRLFPVVPLNGRRALVDTSLPVGGGPDGKSPVYIRKGQEVYYSVYSMQRRKDLWGDDAAEFKPERWGGRRPGWEYLPFNGGPRICIGQQFALTEAGYVVVRLCQKFDKLEDVGNSWESVEKGGYGFIRQDASLTNCPADGVKVRLREAKD